MHRKSTPFARKVRQFKHLSKTINRLLDSGRYYELSRRRRQDLVFKLRRLYKKLRTVFSSGQLRRALAGAALIFGLSQAGQAQTFGPEVVGPFNFQNSFSIHLPTFVDIDNDGDLDMVTSGYGDDYLELFLVENTGTPQSPDFSVPQATPFGLTDQYILTPAFADIDGDGDQDLMLGGLYNYGGGFIFHENTGTAENPVFGAAQFNPFGLTSIPAYYFSFPSFADIDNDGDFDLFASSYYGRIQFYENIGTAQSPSFSTPTTHPFGIVPNAPYSYFRAFDFADVDKDCDQDLLYYSYDEYSTGGSTIFYQENIGTPESPLFDAPVQEPFGIIYTGDYITQPAFADIDSDGDQDLFLGTYMAYGGLSFFENLLDDSNPTSPGGEISVTEGWPHFFEASDFIINDPEGNPLDAVRITSLPDLGTLQFNGDPVTVGQVIDAADLNQLKYTPLAAQWADEYTSFTYQVSDGSLFDCSGAVMVINVTENVGTEERILDANIFLAPNPATGWVHLNAVFSSAPGTLEVSILDLLGKVVAHQTFEGVMDQFQTQLELSGLTPGIYAVHFRSESRFTTARLVVE